MTFTEEDIPLMKLIFNPSTHAMGMIIGRERAEEIFNYVCDKIIHDKEVFLNSSSDFFEAILRNEYICNFFWDNNILQLSLLISYDIAYILGLSPIAKDIWDSGKLDLTKLDDEDMYFILKNSPIAKDIWDSGKLNIALLDEQDLKEFKKKFES